MTSFDRAVVPPTRVLVIDDSSLVRLYYRDALERAGFQVEQAMNGLEAMEKTLDGRFDLLVVDVNMPKMDGFSFLREVRRSRTQAAAIPALVITTEAGPDDMKEARAAGANFYLVKPVSEKDLVAYAEILAGRLK